MELRLYKSKIGAFKVIDAEIIDTADGAFVAVINGWNVKAESREHAERIVGTAKMAFNLGQREARRAVRESLGLSVWGGDVSCTDR